jgi:hypothetical protein
MKELNFIKYLIKLSNKYDSNIHKYYPTKELRDLFNEKLCKNFNLDLNTIINIEINLLKNFNLVVNEISKKVKLIKSINKKFVLCPSRIVIKNISHAILIVYWKDENKFYICDSTGTHGDCQKTSDFLNKIYNVVFDSNYEIICYSIQDLEHKNKYIGFIQGEYSRGYCLAWTYLLGYLIIKYNWMELNLNELIDCVRWNIEYSPKLSRQLVRGFLVYNLT